MMDMQGMDVFLLAAVMVVTLGIFEFRRLIWKRISGAIFWFRAPFLFEGIFGEVWNEETVERQQKFIDGTMYGLSLGLSCCYDDLRKTENLLRETTDPKALKELLKKWKGFEKKAETLGHEFIQARDIARHFGFEAKDWFTDYLAN